MNLSNQITISVPLINLLIAGGFLLIAFLGISYYIFYLNKKVNVLTPKFGFGGKNVTTIALVAFLAGIAPLTTLLLSNDTDIRRQAAESDIVVLNIQNLDNVDGENDYVVGFSAIPMRSGVAWPEDSFTAVWEVTGPTSFTFLEQDLNNLNPSYFTKVLESGEYEVKVIVKGKDFEIEEITVLSL